jgi:hypothetical protein
VDRDNQIFLYRSSQATWLAPLSDAFSDAVEALLGDTLSQPAIQREHEERGARGPHFPCIIGHHRQYLKVVLPEMRAAYSNAQLLSA